VHGQQAGQQESGSKLALSSSELARASLGGIGKS
jgi:hypothetical protein